MQSDNRIGGRTPERTTLSGDARLRDAPEAEQWRAAADCTHACGLGALGVLCRGVCSPEWRCASPSITTLLRSLQGADSIPLTHGLLVEQ